VLDPIPGNPLICPVRAYREYVAECSNLGLSLDDPFAKFSRVLPSLSFEKFLAMFNVIVPTIPATPAVKGHFTGHTFRRGHAQAAIALGIEEDDLMLFGNWRSAPSVRNYTAGAVKASALSLSCFVS
jgi:hypothetical protein